MRLQAGQRVLLPLEVPHKVATHCLWGPPVLLELASSVTYCVILASYPEPGRGVGEITGLVRVRFPEKSQLECS